MARWPYEISIEAFRDRWVLEGDPFWRSVFEMHKDKMQIKNPNVAVVNLEKIFTATFRLANSKGFQAMSLRDLSKETGISMGGLYAYIGSKNDLASVIEGVQRKYIDQVIVNNDRILRIFESNYSLIEPDDVEVFKQFDVDLARHKVEIDEDGRTKTPHQIHEHIGNISFMRPGFIETVNRRFEGKKAELDKLVRRWR